MALYVGMDVSQKETEVCVIDGDGRRTWRGKCLSRPECIAAVLRQHAPDAARIGMETGPLSIWLWHSLRNLGIPVSCIHATCVRCLVAAGQQDGHQRCTWHRSIGSLRMVS
jgi:transposase